MLSSPVQVGCRNHAAIHGADRTTYPSPGERIDNRKVDLNARAGYNVMGYREGNQYDWASEYFHFDWEWAQAPEVRHQTIRSPSLRRTFEGAGIRHADDGYI